VRSRIRSPTASRLFTRARGRVVLGSSAQAGGLLCYRPPSRQERVAHQSQDYREHYVLTARIDVLQDVAQKMFD
jgi:hypothetical protein